MELYEKILLQRICSLEQLDPVERQQAKESPRLLAAIAENRLFANLGAGHPPPPDKQAALGRAAVAANQQGGFLMSLVTSTFSSKSWGAKLAITVVLLAVVAAAWLLPQTPSLAQTNGYMLVYDFGKVAAENCDDCSTLMDGPLKSLETAIRAWADKRRADNPDAQSNRIAISVNVDNGHMTASVALADPNEDLLCELRDVICEVEGMPEPTICDATWFHEKGAFDPKAGISLSAFGHFFSFPKGTSAEDIEAQVNEWLSENKPDLKAKVDVSIEGEGENQDVKIMIKLSKD